ncbi:S1C family serine protease [Paenibacillus crassostreae]|uniref:Trypsin n=1 Tax=Paenibacillus crassostreae TaxID=1763538 RepID=A0A167E2M3_9BACL|nr:trypsin-like peptidase domain-containing protein [Paenibacillus crassostreae]AOZ93286.1 trypsin [Paenibacillus crassostreae]OAB75069.1 trypsin [Paenibacillus crassostreae]
MDKVGKGSAIILLCSLMIVSGMGTVQAKQQGTTTSTKVSSTATNTSKVSADPIPQIVKDISPSVVGIIGKGALGQGNSNSDRYNLVHGTGVIVRANGWIVTNAHVVSGVTNTMVVTSNGKSYPIQKVFIDETSDLAVVKIAANGLTPAKFTKSLLDTEVGEKVIAIGTPVSFSLRNSATVGVVSGMNRGVNAAYRLIQSDTAINPGNSGGPLVNMKGEVLGINTMKFAAVGVENMGFSIPSDTVQYVINQLMTYGEVKRPSLGLSLEESWSAIVGLPTDEPLTVTKVLTPEAEAAGIQEDDLLYSINGIKVTNNVDINELFKTYAPSQTVKLLMQSDGDIVIRRLVLSRQGLFLNSESEVEI